MMCLNHFFLFTIEQEWDILLFNKKYKTHLEIDISYTSQEKFPQRQQKTWKISGTKKDNLLGYLETDQ